METPGHGRFYGWLCVTPFIRIAKQLVSNDDDKEILSSPLHITDPMCGKFIAL